MAETILHRNDTKTNWVQKNPIIPNQELIFENGTSMKFGDGVKKYSELPYLSTGLDSKNVVFVKPGSTQSESAELFKSAYAKAKLLSPSVTNVINIIVAPGNYSWGNATPLILNEPYINIISLTKYADVIVGAMTFDETVEAYFFADTKYTGLINDTNLASSTFLSCQIPTCKFENCIFNGSNNIGVANKPNYGKFFNCTFKGVENLQGASISNVTVENCINESDNGFNVKGVYKNCINSSIEGFNSNDSYFFNCIANEGGFNGLRCVFENCKCTYNEATNIFTNTGSICINCIWINASLDNQYTIIPNKLQ